MSLTHGGPLWCKLTLEVRHAHCNCKVTCHAKRSSARPLVTHNIQLCARQIRTIVICQDTSFGFELPEIAKLVITPRSTTFLKALRLKTELKFNLFSICDGNKLQIQWMQDRAGERQFSTKYVS